MKKIFALFSLMSAAAFLLGFINISLQDNEPAGKKVFMDSKCQNCHSVQSENLETKSKKKDVPDLSNVGSQHDAKFLKDFLNKKEKVDGKNHPAAFKGTEADLDSLTNWLASLKGASGMGGTESMQKDSTM